MSAATIAAAAVDSAARRLQEAALRRRPCRPVRDLIGRDEIAAAYAVQQRVNADRVAAGGVVVGRKIGLTSEAVQQQLGVDQPDLGVLFADMGYEPGAVLPAGRFLQPRVEAEVAFVLGDDLVDGDLDLSQVRAAVDHAVAALEVCDSRIADWDISFGDTVADNASSGAYVLSSARVRLTDLEPRQVLMRMTVTGQEVSAGTGAACLGDPLLALQWLARQARDLGDPLEAGQVVLSGALGPMRPLLPGARVTATISGLGPVSCQLSEEE
jgi:2-keto-4-pentenoate hydratase